MVFYVFIFCNILSFCFIFVFFFFQAEDGIRDRTVTWSSDVCSSDLACPGSDPSGARHSLHVQYEKGRNSRYEYREQQTGHKQGSTRKPRVPRLLHKTPAPASGKLASKKSPSTGSVTSHAAKLVQYEEFV